MPGKYYAAGDDRADKVEDLFATIAPRYDLINDLQSFGLHRRWKRKLIRLARVRPGEEALDVCCGTGDVAFRLAQAGANVTGVDFSEAMLAVAQARLPPSLPPDSIRFVRADALHLPMAEDRFDVVTVSYGLRNLADWQAGLREFHRVLRPGGRLFILDFGKPDGRVWRWFYYQYLRWVVPRFGRWFFNDADTHSYIVDSLQAYPAQRGVDAGLRQLGFVNVTIYHLLGGIMGINAGCKPGRETSRLVRP